MAGFVNHDSKGIGLEIYVLSCYGHPRMMFSSMVIMEDGGVAHMQTKRAADWEVNSRPFYAGNIDGGK